MSAIDDLGPVMTATECKNKLENMTTWPGTAVYMLIDRNSGSAIYCGTANSKSRLKSHLHKDDLRNGPVGKTMVNPELRAYCLAQPKGWLGVQFKIFASEEVAKQKEREIIGQLGIKRSGGLLYNQRLSG